MNDNKIAITPSERVGEIKEYYFSRKLREVAKLNKEGWDIVSLGIGGPDRMPDETVIETLCHEATRPDVHSYQSYNGLPKLRQAFAEWYKSHYGVNLDPESEILPLIGSKEGVLHITLAFVNPGDTVLVPNPGYPTYTSVSKIAGANIVQYSLMEKNGWLPDFETLEKLATEHHPKLMWVNYPNMPTGAQASDPVFDRLIEFCQRHGIVLVHDNPYSFILNDHPRSLLSRPGAKDIAIELNSLSKSHNMAGWRIGMAASNPTFISWILKIKSNIDSGQFRPMMSAAASALRLSDDWYKQLNEVYSRRRAVAEQIMTTLECKFDAAQKGLFLWGKIPDGCRSAEEFTDEILYKARVFITPGSIFGSNGDRYVRISLCADEQRLNEALRRVKQYTKTK